MPDRSANLVTPALLVAAALFAGCTSSEREQPLPPTITSGGAARSTRAPKDLDTVSLLQLVEPVRLRIHPLSRLERDDKNRLRLTCHLELADRAGHSGKWLGKVRVELYRPADPSGESVDPVAMSGGERQSKYWEVDLTDPDQNALVYDDLVTRTYILPLVDLPDWVSRLQQGTSREPWLTLRAYFITSDAKGKERILESTTRIRREGVR